MVEKNIPTIDSTQPYGPLSKSRFYGTPDTATSGGTEEQTAQQQEKYAGLPITINPGDLPEEEYAALAKRLENLGGAQAFAAKTNDNMAVQEALLARGASYLDYFDALVSRAMPPEPSDIARSITEQVMAGTVKPTPELLNYLLSMPPELMKKPTPRSVAKDAIVTSIMSSAAAVGQNIANIGRSAVPVEDAGAAVFGQGMQRIEDIVAQDKQLETAVAMKNVEIMNKYRDDILSSVKEMDKLNNDFEKEKLKSINTAISKATEVYKAKLGYRQKTESAVLGAGQKMVSVGAGGMTKERAITSREAVSAAESKTSVSMKNAELNLRKLNSALQITKMKTEGQIKVPVDPIANTGVASALNDAEMFDLTQYSLAVSMPMSQDKINYGAGFITKHADEWSNRLAAATEAGADPKKVGALTKLQQMLAPSGQYLSPDLVNDIISGNITDVTYNMLSPIVEIVGKENFVKDPANVINKIISDKANINKLSAYLKTTGQDIPESWKASGATAESLSGLQGAWNIAFTNSVAQKTVIPGRSWWRSDTTPMSKALEQVKTVQKAKKAK